MCCYYRLPCTFKRLLASWRAVTTCWWNSLALQLRRKCRDAIQSSALTLCYWAAEYCAPVRSHSSHTGLAHVQLNASMRLIPDTLHLFRGCQFSLTLNHLPWEGRPSLPPSRYAESNCSWQLANSLWHYINKNSSGDEIANVNVYAVRPEATRIRWNNAK